jgi:hypothetical protein
MIKKIFIIIFITYGLNFCYAENGLYLGGGIGSGMQELNANSINGFSNTPAIRIFTGYQFISWFGAEVAYNYINQGSDFNNYGSPSTTIYDLSFTPGLPLTVLPLTIFSRIGINSVSTNMNSNWYNQVFSNSTANFEWGGGIKINIPASNFFVRAEYISFNPTKSNANSSISVNTSVALISAAYVF